MSRIAFHIIALIAVLGLAGCQTETAQSGSNSLVLGDYPDLHAVAPGVFQEHMRAMDRWSPVTETLTEPGSK